MSPTGTIGVVVTCRDLGRLLLEALESVERQTRPASEVIIVDDGSTDIHTRQVLARLESDGTSVLAGQGRGASAARNLGARFASSDYLVFLDGDDILEPTYFEAAAARLDSDPSLDYVTSGLRAFGASRYLWTPAPLDLVSAVATGGVPHASTIMRRGVWDSVGGFDERLRSFELLDFWTSVLERGLRGVVLPEPMLNYRIRPGSGYRRSIQPTAYRMLVQHFHKKHRETIERYGVELILAKEAFLQDQREYQRTLESRAAAVQSEIAALRQEVADLARSLESRGLKRVDWADLRRRRPLSSQWGWDRGTPVDRHYIEGFLERHRAGIRGRVLEVRDAVYTRRFGVSITAADVVDIDSSNSAATIVADLRHAASIADESYDCIILTQTLQLIDDTAAVLRECERILRPGGVLLVTVPSLIRVDDEAGVDGDFWRWTEASARTLFAATFPADAFEVTAFGNLMACTAFLYGLSVEELSAEDLDARDPDFPMVVAVRAVKPTPARPGAAPAVRSLAGQTGTSNHGIVLAYHRIATLAPDSHALCTAPELFREHMAYIARDCTPLALEELVAAAASGRIPDRAVAVTLDDGYLDALTAASPILEQAAVPATFFVNTERLHEAHERCWDTLEHALLGTERLPPVLSIEIGGMMQPPLPTVTTADRAAALNRLNELAWPLDSDGRHRLAADVLAWSGIDPSPRPTHRVFTGDELLTLSARRGHAIGAHTTHHLALGTQNADTKRKEIFENKETLERLLRRPVNLFAYPYGDFDAETVGLVREAGFRAAVTVRRGRISFGANRLLLPRCEVPAAMTGAAFRGYVQELFGAAHANMLT